MRLRRVNGVLEEVLWHVATATTWADRTSDSACAGSRQRPSGGLLTRQAAKADRLPISSEAQYAD